MLFCFFYTDISLYGFYDLQSLSEHSWNTLHSCQHIVFLSTSLSPLLTHCSCWFIQGRLIIPTFALRLWGLPFGRVLGLLSLLATNVTLTNTTNARLFSRFLEEMRTATHQFITYFTHVSKPSTFDFIPGTGMVTSAWELSCMDAMVRDGDSFDITTKENLIRLITFKEQRRNC